VPPSLPAALGLGLRALLREPWLVPVGAVVAGVRRAAVWPALAVLWIVLSRAALGALAERPLDPAAPFEAAMAALRAPRLVALVAGLWLAGALLAAALRVAWLAGALPTLGGAMAGAAGTPRFARGVAFGFPAVLATAALALAAETAAALFSATLVLAALRVTAHAAGAGGGAALAAAVALAGAVAAAVPVAVGAVSDAAVARAALRLEGPGRAFAASTRRFLARPGTFVLAALALGLAAAAGPAAVEAAGGVATAFAGDAPPLVLLGPNLMLAAGALAVAAALDLLWLATVSALACAGDVEEG
jgi:hypothetical protein